LEFDFPPPIFLRPTVIAAPRRNNAEVIKRGGVRNGVFRSKGGFEFGFRRLHIAGLEVNISCPNIKKGGISFGTDPREAFKVVSTVRKSFSGPLMVKLSPNVSDITAIARSAEDAGADVISLINTLMGMAIDIDTRRPRLGNITGGLSGPAIKPVALRMVWEVYRSVSIPVVGIGGICSSRDALEFIIAGASAVQIGTAQFVNPRVAGEVVSGIGDYLRTQGMTGLKELVGSLIASPH